MMEEAERHAAEDKVRRETIDVRNKLDSIVFQTEKNLRENGDKIPADMKSSLETELASARSVLETKSEDKAALESAITALEAKAHKLAEEMYKNAGAQGQNPQGSPNAEGGAQGNNQNNSKNKDGVVDAEFESNN